MPEQVDEGDGDAAVHVEDQVGLLGRGDLLHLLRGEVNVIHLEIRSFFNHWAIGRTVGLSDWTVDTDTRPPFVAKYIYSFFLKHV